MKTKMTYIFNIFVLLGLMIGTQIHAQMQSRDSITIQFPKGGSFQFEILSAKMAKMELSSGSWSLHSGLSEKWGHEFYEDTKGRVLEIASSFRLGILFHKPGDPSLFVGRIVFYISQKGDFCPHVLIDKEEVEILLEVPGTKHIANIKEHGEIDVYLLPDNRVFTRHKAGGVGELYLCLADFQTVEQEMSGFNLIIAIPGSIHIDGTQPEGVD